MSVATMPMVEDRIRVMVAMARITVMAVAEAAKKGKIRVMR